MLYDVDVSSRVLRNFQVKDFSEPSRALVSTVCSLPASCGSRACSGSRSLPVLAAVLGQHDLPAPQVRATGCEICVWTHNKEKSISKDSLDQTVKLVLFFFPLVSMWYSHRTVEKREAYFACLSDVPRHSTLYNNINDLIQRTLTSSSSCSYDAKHTLSNFHSCVFSLLPRGYGWRCTFFLKFSWRRWSSNF